MFGNTFDYSQNITPIDGIEFNVLGNNDVLEKSVFPYNSVGITSSELHIGGEYKDGGLNDIKMGTTDKKFKCATCGLIMQYCDGHSGHIKMATPIYHIGYYDELVNILSCICLNCSNLLDPNINTSHLKNRLKLAYVKKNSKNISVCKKCNTSVKIIKKYVKKNESSINIQVETKMTDNDKKIMDTLPKSRVFNILKNISDEDANTMGLSSRPENLMITNLIVPPMPMRPSVRGDFGTTTVREDQLTTRLVNIYKANSKTVKSIDTLKYEDSHIDWLQTEVATYFNKTSFVNNQSKGKLLADLSSRIKQKEGRIRHSLMGKRVNFSARTVITPDPSLSINQLRIPLKIAMKLTYPEIVTPENKKRLEKYIQNGPNRYPGAKLIFKKSNNYTSNISISPNKIYNIEYGDVVNRHLLDDDIILFNRQPTLHKHGTLAHKIIVDKLNDINTFMFNPSVCKGYNADYDGDEMNCHTVQSVQTQIELEEICDVGLQIINPRMSLPIVGIVYDSLIGSYYSTKFNGKINKNDFMNMLSSVEIDEIKDIKNYDGYELFDNIIPNNINLSNKNLKISNGNIKSGYISADVIGSYKQNSLQQLILDEYGSKEAMKFINNVIKLSINYNLLNGFTICIGDFMLSKEQKNNKNQVIETKLLEVEHEITEYENNSDIIDSSLFEHALFSKLEVISSDMNKFISDTLSDKNNAMIMLKSGSKGKEINLTQIMCCRGQLDVFSSKKRMLKNYNNRGLPYFFQNDDRPKARAFIQNPFMNGMTLSENLYEIMTCRESQIDTAVKTADTGYIQRKLIKSTEDFMVMYDGTVRNSSNKIQQFVYGGGGANTYKQHGHYLTFYEMNDEKIKETFKFTESELKGLKNYSNKDNDDLYNMIIDFRNNIRNIYIKSTLIFNGYDSTFMIPVNIKRIIENAKMHEYDESIINDPKYIIEQIEYILDNKNTLLIPMSENELNDKSSIKNKDSNISKSLFKYCLYDMLSPKKSIIENKFTKSHIEFIVKNIILSYNKSIVDVGEMVGILAAQCLGEPLTQMTLKSFHSAGLGSATGGVPRLKEIISVTKTDKINDPIMNVYFKDKYKKDSDYVKKISAYIKYTTIEDIRNKIEIFYDPNPNDFIIKDNITAPFVSSKQSKTSCSDKIDNLPWLIRITFNKEKLFLKEITLLDIKSKFCNFWENRYNESAREKKKTIDRINNLSISSNTINDDNPIIHIRIDMNNPDIDKLKEFSDIIVDGFKLKGIHNIEDVISDKEQTTFNFEKDGTIKKDTEHIIITKGINLKDIRKIIGIDLNKTFTTDIISVYENFGVEATRNIIITEMIQIFKSKGESINYQHIEIFADLMTNTGVLTQIAHHGFNKLDTSILSRITFERPVEQLITASLFGEKDNIQSVSGNVMFGKCFKGGTGSINILLDTEKIINSEYIYDDNNYNKNYNNITIKTEFEIDENVFIPDF
jgi:DNA-directed RNA polymerase II subunit RPB1